MASPHEGGVPCKRSELDVLKRWLEAQDVERVLLGEGRKAGHTHTHTQR